jgi:RNA polymerase-interacting CarD/CdnL/TRCF family regulator
MGLGTEVNAGNRAEFKEDLMQLKIGDSVVHPAFGIGHIVEIEEKSFFEKEVHLYYKITRPKHAMWVRVEAREGGGLRLVTTKSELDYYRDLLKSSPVPLNTNQQQRQLDLASRLKQGSFQGVCEVVRDLTAWNWRKPLGQADTTTLQKSRDSLYQEWATAADVSAAEAITEIDSLLRATRQADRELI